jgi:hypothetical protein
VNDDKKVEGGGWVGKGTELLREELVKLIDIPSLPKGDWR